MTDMVTIRRLKADDMNLWKEIRQAALEFAPRAFGRTLASHHLLSDSDHAARLSETAVFGAFSGDDIVGSASWYAVDFVTETHRGKINSVFVRPDRQGHGVADALFDAVLADARGKVLQLELTVSVGFPRSLAFYHRRGFEITGTTPRALCHDGIFSAEHAMMLRLDA